MITLLLFGILFVFLFLGVPIALCLGMAVFTAMFFNGDQQLFPVIVQRMFTQTDNFSFMAVPFFILAGNIMEKGGISSRLIDFFELLLQRIAARVACITVVASAFFGAISGSNPATVAAIGGITVPRMKQKGYPADVAGAIAASAGTLGVIIPPSIPMVTYAVTASVSVGAVFMGGIIPGLILAAVLVVTNMIACKKYEAAEQVKVLPKDLWSAFLSAFLALLMPLIILGGIYGGLFTPTESAAVASVYALLISLFVYREMKIKDLYKVFRDSAISSAVIMLVIGMSSPFAWFMTYHNLTTELATSALTLFNSKIALLLMMNLILLFLGCFLETQSIILLVTPILLPIATAIGLDPIALGIIIIVNTSIGMITPPMAVNIFVAAGVSGASIGQISKRMLLYLGVEIATLLVFTYIPGIITFLPRALA